MIQSFAPISAPDARVLVLGSMPGQASLDAQRYYAHPRNAFWPIMSALFEIDASANYAMRCRALQASGVAVWDVLRSCERPGSLDADIVEATIEANDFAGFFAQHPSIRHVFFNGAKAEAAYRRYVLRALASPYASLPVTRLPSTSPAHAAMRVPQKLEQWRVVCDALSIGQNKTTTL